MVGSRLQQTANINLYHNDLLYMLAVHYFYPTINNFMFVLFIIIVFGCFELVIFCFVKFST